MRPIIYKVDEKHIGLLFHPEDIVTRIPERLQLGSTVELSDGRVKTPAKIRHNGEYILNFPARLKRLTTLLSIEEVEGYVPGIGLFEAVSNVSVEYNGKDKLQDFLISKGPRATSYKHLIVNRVILLPDEITDQKATYYKQQNVYGYLRIPLSNLTSQSYKAVLSSYGHNYAYTRNKSNDSRAFLKGVILEDSGNFECVRAVERYLVPRKGRKSLLNYVPTLDIAIYLKVFSLEYLAGIIVRLLDIGVDQSIIKHIFTDAEYHNDTYISTKNLLAQLNVHSEFIMTMERTLTMGDILKAMARRTVDGILLPSLGLDYMDMLYMLYRIVPVLGNCGVKYTKYINNYVAIYYTNPLDRSFGNYILIYADEDTQIEFSPKNNCIYNMVPSTGPDPFTEELVVLLGRKKKINLTKGVLYFFKSR